MDMVISTRTCGLRGWELTYPNRPFDGRGKQSLFTGSSIAASFFITSTSSTGAASSPSGSTLLSHSTPSSPFLIFNSAAFFAACAALNTLILSDPFFAATELFVGDSWSPFPASMLESLYQSRTIVNLQALLL